MTHPLLERQIRRLKRKHPDGELQLDQLLELVSTTYAQLDEERQKKDRSLALMSEEMMELNRQSMQRHEAYVSKLVEQVVDGVITLGGDLKVARINEAAVSMLGKSSEELLGKPFTGLFVREDGTMMEIDTGISDSEGYQEIDIYGQRKSGEDFSAELSISKISQGAEGIFYLVIIRDVSQQKEAEALLVEAKDKAEALARSKSDFLSTMSHEIRTPLNAVIGMTGLLSDTGLTAEQEDFVGTIKTGGEALLSIINDVLDFSKIESQRLDLEELPFQVIEPVEDTMDLLAGKAHKKNLDLLYEVKPNVPHLIKSDITRLRQVLVNLVGNAIKFTDSGQVLVTIEAEQAGVDRHLFRFSVMDTGIGIPEERIDRLFKSFSQVDASTTRKYGGSGLGLAICKGIVEALGGRIWVESEEGVGTSFRFEFESGSGKHPPSQSLELLNDLVGKDVLVIDDNEVNLSILARQLSGWKMNPVIHQSPHLALKALREGLNVDLVITDHQMPGMTGLDFFQRMRQLEEKAGIPVILFSSGVERIPPDLYKKLAGVISKPGKQDIMLKTINRALRGESELNRIVNPERERIQFPGLKVLLVEDNSVNQKVALRMLKKLGIEADIAGNGQEAVDIAGKIRYDIILMDMMMPVMDGIEATKVIRSEEHPQTHRANIIAMTANVMKEDVMRCEEAGMDDFLSKPVRLEKLEQTILEYSQIVPVGESV